MYRQIRSNQYLFSSCTITQIWKLKKIENVSKVKLMLGDLIGRMKFVFTLWGQSKNMLHCICICQVAKFGIWICLFRLYSSRMLICSKFILWQQNVELPTKIFIFQNVEYVVVFKTKLFTHCSVMLTFGHVKLLTVQMGGSKSMFYRIMRIMCS